MIIKIKRGGERVIDEWGASLKFVMKIIIKISSSQNINKKASFCTFQNKANYP